MLLEYLTCSGTAYPKARNYKDFKLHKAEGLMLLEYLTCSGTAYPKARNYKDIKLRWPFGPRCLISLPVVVQRTQKPETTKISSYIRPKALCYLNTLPVVVQ